MEWIQTFNALNLNRILESAHELFGGAPLSRPRYQVARMLMGTAMHTAVTRITLGDDDTDEAITRKSLTRTLSLADLELYPSFSINSG